MGWPLFVLLLLATLAAGEETCLSAEDDPYFMFGTKTAYIFATRGIPNTRAHEVTGCEPKALWMLNRHGSHTPEANEFADLQMLGDLKNNIVTNYNVGNLRDTNRGICRADLDLLKGWQWSYRQNLTLAGDVTSDGYMTTQQLAQAFKQRFPGLLTNNRHDYLFKFVTDERSKNTFKAFTEGIFGAQAEGYDVAKENDEKLLRAYNFCPSWKKDVLNNNDTMAQLNIFQSKSEFKEMLSNISVRLGFNYEVEPAIIQKIYQICRYDKAKDVAKISPWCALKADFQTGGNSSSNCNTTPSFYGKWLVDNQSLYEYFNSQAFTHADLKRLEYAEDLETYYKYGYGSELNKKMGCNSIKDMYDFFTNHVSHDEPQQPRSLIQFTEAPTLLMTLTTLGQHYDLTPLTGDNYHTNSMQSRKWTTSTMSPFNANIAAVLYQCTTNGNFQIKEKYQVLFLENEKPIYIDGCRVGLCDWSLVKAKFGGLAETCNMEFCNGATTFSSFVGLSIAIVTFFARYMVT